MAVHKFMAIKDGGYFYKFHPCFPTFKEPEETLIRYTLFDFPPVAQTKKNHYSFLYGKFISKYSGKDFTIHLEQKGKLFLYDCYTETMEEREVESVLIIRVDEEIYNFKFKKDSVYHITTEAVNEIITDINPEP